MPDFHPIDALKARVYLRQGRLSEALDWARERGLSVDDDLSYLGEFEHITLARVLIAQHQYDPLAGSIHQAIALLERLLQAAEADRRMGSVVEILVVQALALQAQGNVSQALALVERALALAEPEGYVRIFVDEGEPMRLLILDCGLWIEKQFRNHVRLQRGYVDRLLAAFAQPAVTPQSKIENPQSAMLEPLSQRELEILKLITQGLSNREIGERLFLALDTVKGHNRRIFAKLQVQRRTEAITRARELDLL